MNTVLRVDRRRAPRRRRRGAAGRPLLWVAGIAVLVVVVLVFALRSTPPATSPPGEMAATPAPSRNSPAATAEVGKKPDASPTAPAGPKPAQAETPAARPFSPAQGNAPAAKPPIDPNDLPPDHPPITAETGSQVSLQWLGHACFYIHSPGGVAVVTDPFDPRATGLARPEIGAHLVTVSGNSREHSFVEAAHPFQGDSWQILRGVEGSRGDTQVTPIPSYRDAANGARKGRNTLYLIQSGPMRIAHLGSLGHTLQPHQLKALGEIDILLLPVGDDSLAPATAVKVAQQVNPRIVIPMAYATPEMEGAARLDSVDAFIAASPFAVTRKDSDIILISKPELPASTEIFTLRYQRGLYTAGTGVR